MGRKTTDAHCARGYGPSALDMVPTVQPPQVLVIECSGSDKSSLPDFYGVTIRFQPVDPHATACQLTEHYRNQEMNVQGPSGR